MMRVRKEIIRLFIVSSAGSGGCLLLVQRTDTKLIYMTFMKTRGPKSNEKFHYWIYKGRLILTLVLYVMI
jgi:hypothetical protein